jgi:hypothetical protein
LSQLGTRAVNPELQLATFAPETTGRIGSVMQKLVRCNGAGV